MQDAARVFCDQADVAFAVLGVPDHGQRLVGFANEGLWPGNNYPRADSPGTLQIKKLSAAGHPTMYQFHLPVTTVAEMKTSLDKGIANGARGIEIFPGNCNQSEMWPLFDDANTRMLAGGEKLKAKVKAK